MIPGGPRALVRAMVTFTMVFAAWFLAADPGAAPEAASGRIEAPPFTIRYPEALAAEAERIAGTLPGTMASIRKELRAPPLPHSTLYLSTGAGPRGPDDPESIFGPVPEWAAGIAYPGIHAILVRTDRIGSYAQRRLDGVVSHECAHLVMAEAAGPGGQDRMPRWFREGVAGHVARDGEWLDFLHLWFSPVASSGRPLATLEATFRFADGPAMRRAAYAGSFSFVSLAIERHGEDMPARVLSHLREGADFEDAWRLATSATLAHDETAWAHAIQGGRRWLAILSSSFTLWAVITLLFILAGAAKRRRSRRTMESWSEVEAADGGDEIDR